MVIDKPDKINLKSTHLQARRMVSHNKKWNYILHIEDDLGIKNFS